MSELGHKPSVSFVLPAFNEEEFIEDVLERLDSSLSGNGLRYEVVVVDDGSVDDTRLRALRYAVRNGHVRVVGHDRNVGKGYAIRTGFWLAMADAVVFVDSDLDIGIDQIELYVEALASADIVVGSKWHKDSVVEITFVRKVLSRGFNILVRLLTGVKVRDTQTGIKAIQRRAFERVFRRMCVKRYAFDVELLVAASVCGLKVVELPAKLRIASRFSLVEVWRMILDLLGIAYRLKVKKWYSLENSTPL